MKIYFDERFRVERVEDAQFIYQGTEGVDPIEIYYDNTYKNLECNINFRRADNRRFGPLPTIKKYNANNETYYFELDISNQILAVAGTLEITVCFILLNGNGDTSGKAYTGIVNAEVQESVVINNLNKEEIILNIPALFDSFNKVLSTKANSDETIDWVNSCLRELQKKADSEYTYDKLTSLETSISNQSNSIYMHKNDNTNPHKVTAAQVGAYTIDAIQKLFETRDILINILRNDFIELSGHVAGHLNNAESDLNKAVNEEIAKLVGNSPETLNTLYKIANSLNNDPNLYLTLMEKINEKASLLQLTYKQDKLTNGQIYDINIIPSILQQLEKIADRNEVFHLIDGKIAELIDGSPDALNTLYEISKALNDDPNFYTTIIHEIAKKANISDLDKYLTKTIWGSNVGAGQSGYIKIAKLTIKGTYMNSPIIFDLIQRGRNDIARIVVYFQNVSSLNPDLSALTIETSAATGTNAFIYRTEPGIWELYVQKTEANDWIGIVDFKNTDYGASRVEITWMSEFAATLPSGNIQATSRYRKASQFAIPRKINGVDFDGSKDITIPAGEATKNVQIPALNAWFEDITQNDENRSITQFLIIKSEPLSQELYDFIMSDGKVQIHIYRNKRGFSKSIATDDFRIEKFKFVHPCYDFENSSNNWGLGKHNDTNTFVNTEINITSENIITIDATHYIHIKLEIIENFMKKLIFYKDDQISSFDLSNSGKRLSIHFNQLITNDDVSKSLRFLNGRKKSCIERKSDERIGMFYATKHFVYMKFNFVIYKDNEIKKGILSNTVGLGMRFQYSDANMNKLKRDFEIEVLKKVL